MDREYRHPRLRSESKRRTRHSHEKRPTESPRLPPQMPAWEFLPPLPEVVEAVRSFTLRYFQLGFIPKQVFIERLEKNARSVSVLLLLVILSISARFTPSLVERYGHEVKAAELFMERAQDTAMREIYLEPTLERCQGFFLLAISQQGSGYKNRSSVRTPGAASTRLPSR